MRENHWLSRRSLFRIGGISLACSAKELLSGTPEQLPVKGNKQREDAASKVHAGADQVIFLWLPGGVTHHESFDPKPEAPQEIRGDIQPIATNVPGVYFSEVMPLMAKQMDKIALVRSYAAGTNDHFDGQAYALSGRTVLPSGILSEPNVGAIVNHQLGPKGDLPGYICVPGTTEPGPPNTNLFVSAWLGQKYAPFQTRGEPRKPDFQVQDLALSDGVTVDRFGKRRELRQLLEDRLQEVDSQRGWEGMEQLYGRATQLLTSPKVRKAFEIREEPEAVRARYGMSKLGQRCLLARRLIEAGSRFVMVDYGYDWGEYNNLWDNHCAPGQDQPHMWKMCKVDYHLPAVDRAYSALLEDLSQSGRLERTLVVYMTEFGRTPTINPNGGRDHWGYSGSIFFAGGGVRGGQVLGATDKVGGYCTSRTYSPADAAATIYSAVGIDSETLLYTPENRPVAIQPHGDPIPVF